MLGITLVTMGAKRNFPNGERPDPEPIPAQSPSRHLSNDQMMDQPFNEWHPHRMKTAFRNHPVGRKASMVALPLLGYNAAAPQHQKTRGAPVNDQSGRRLSRRQSSRLDKSLTPSGVTPSS